MTDYVRFSDADLTCADLTTADLSGNGPTWGDPSPNICPDGTTQAGTCVGHLTLGACPVATP